MENKTRWGIIAVSVFLLAGIGGTIILTQDELDHAYRCNTNGKVGVFESLSKTNSTGYWYVDGVKKQSTCTKGKWEYLKTWCETNNIKNCGRVETTAQEDVYTGKYWCTDTCDPIIE